MLLLLLCAELRFGTENLSLLLRLPPPPPPVAMLHTLLAVLTLLVLRRSPIRARESGALLGVEGLLALEEEEAATTSTEERARVLSQMAEEGKLRSGERLAEAPYAAAGEEKTETDLASASTSEEEILLLLLPPPPPVMTARLKRRLECLSW